MDYLKKVEVVVTVPVFFCCEGYMCSKNNTEVKLACGVFYTKKTSGTVYIEFGKFFGPIDGNIFYRTFAFANVDIALMFLAEIDLSFLDRVQYSR